MDAHTPYGYWPEHLKALRGDADIEHTIDPGSEELIEVGEEPPSEVIDAYDAGIRSADEQIGRLLKVIPEETTVVFTGDHGEEFGRFHPFHYASLYGTMTQVPLIVRDDTLEAGRSEMPAQHLDIPPRCYMLLDLRYRATGKANPCKQSVEVIQARYSLH